MGEGTLASPWSREHLLPSSEGDASVPSPHNMATHSPGFHHSVQRGRRKRPLPAQPFPRPYGYEGASEAM